MSSNFPSQTLELGLTLQPYQNHDLDDGIEGMRFREINEYGNSSDDNHCLPSNHQSQDSQSDSAQNKMDHIYKYDGLDTDYNPELDKKATLARENEMSTTNVYRGLIRDQKQYEHLLKSRIEKERNEGLLAYTDTFPGDPSIQRTWAKKIFDAILDLDGIIDKKTKYHNNSSQAARRIRDGYYPDIEIEKTAWKLMLSARDAQIGVRLIEKYHGVKLEDPVRNSVGVFETWADRMNAIINTLRVSKAACKQLMDPHYLDRLVECPNAERQMKKNNKRINTERDIQNQLGRKLLDLKVVPIADVEKEAKKLQNIKEEHRLAAPPKTPRIKKEPFFDGSPLSLTGSSSFTTQKRDISGRKRKRTLQRRRSESDGVEGEKDSDFDPEINGKEFPHCFQRSSCYKRHRPMRSCTNSSMSTGHSPETKVDIDRESSILNEMCIHQKYDPSLMSTASISPYITGSTNINSRQQNHNASKYQDNNGLPPFSLDQNIEIYQTVSSLAPNSMNLSAHPSQSTVAVDQKLIDLYSELICNLLSINPEYAVHISLKDLRLYARAYNFKFFHCPWTHPGLGSNTAKGCCVYDEIAGQNYHISHYFPSLTGIALLRGDIDRNLCMVPGTEYTHLFNTYGDELMDQALGVTENPYGFSLSESIHITKKEIY